MNEIRKSNSNIINNTKDRTYISVSFDKYGNAYIASQGTIWKEISGVAKTEYKEHQEESITNFVEQLKNRAYNPLPLL